MSVLIEGFSVVIRREAIARRYKDGWPRFVADVFTTMSCADSDIAAIGFMHGEDVRACIRRLQCNGFVFLNGAHAAVDIVVLDQRSGPTTPCAWLEFFRQEFPGGTVAAARLAGSHETRLVCPDGWQFEDSLSKSVQFHGERNIYETHEIVAYENGTQILRDRRTRQTRELIRPMAVQRCYEEPSEIDREAIRQKYNALWAEACDLLKPYWDSGNRPRTAAELASVARAREVLEQMIAIPNVRWHAWWLLGVARRLLRDRSGAYAAFACAYGLAPEEIETGRNLAQECIALGHAQEAIRVAAATVKLAPEDAGLVANHAMALLVSGDLDGAFREIRRAEHLDPDDEITLNLRAFVDDVRAGRVEAPSRIDT